MKYKLLMCLLFYFSNCDKMLVKEYTTVEIVCPLNLSETDNLSWYYESTPIVVQNIINPEFKSKYKMNDAFNHGKHIITILNFTESDQGKYSYEGSVDSEYQYGKVTVSLCHKPEMLNTLPNYLDINVWRNTVRQTNSFCYVNISGLSDSYTLIDVPARELTGMIATDNEQSKPYTCFNVNEDKCIITDSEFYINIEWISKDENRNRRLSDEQLYTLTCTRNISSVIENSSCSESTETYLINKTLFFQDFKMADDETYQCSICSIAQNKTDKKRTTIIYKQKGFSLIYGLKVFITVFGAVLFGVFIWCFRKVFMKAKHNADQVQRIVESEDSQEEGYSSIDRRRNIQVGQVSYTASRVSRCSLDELGGCTSVKFGEVAKITRLKTTEISTEQALKTPSIKDKMNRETTCLNYIEVEFSPETTGKKFIIHGSDNVTPYVDIDLTMKADPLPESDSSEDEEPKDNDDVLTLEKLDENV